MRTAKTLIRLGGCPGRSESSLGEHSLCWFCHVVAHILVSLKFIHGDTIGQQRAGIMVRSMSMGFIQAFTPPPPSNHGLWFCWFSMPFMLVVHSLPVADSENFIYMLSQCYLMNSNCCLSSTNRMKPNLIGHFLKYRNKKRLVLENVPYIILKFIFPDYWF